MKQYKSIIAGIIALILIILLSHPEWLPLSAETIAGIEKLKTEYLLFGGSTPITAAHFLTALMAVCTVILVYLVLKGILYALGKANERSGTVTTMVSALLKYIAIIFGAVWVLSIFGVNAVAVLAGIGILGLIIGFGAQSLIEDIITGFFIIFESQYNIGDIIILDDFRGTVRSIGVRTTVIEDAGGNLKVVNNSDIRNFQNRSKNTSKAICIVSVAYDTDIQKMERILAKNLPAMYEMHRDIYLKAPEYLGVEKLADSGVELKFTADVMEKNVFIAQRQLNRDLLVLFKETGIEIPFPQVVVHQGE
ncbi:MAG: mechanosensitive ion channel family protein [Solobacterium sp.]|nr:mechanosensitive ion channel family protein [Solobacterium sp.]